MVVQECPRKPVKNTLFIIVIILTIIMAISAIAMIGLVFFKSHNAKQELDLVESISIKHIKFNGYDGSAHATVDDEKARELINYSGDDKKVKDFIESVSYEIEPNDNLENGDIITIKAVYDNDSADKAGVEIIKSGKTIKVKELEPEPEDIKITEEKKPVNKKHEESNNDIQDETENNTIQMVVDTTYAPEQGGKNDGYAAVRTSPDATSDNNRIAKLDQGTFVTVYADSLENGWYIIADDEYNGCYIHESSLVRGDQY